MNHPRRQVVGVVAWLTGLTTALATVLTVGAERPGSPPLTRPSSWRSWAAEREPLDVVAAGARVVAVVALAYLLIVTLADLAAGVLGARDRRRGRWLARITPRFVGALSAAAIAATSPAGADEAADAARVSPAHFDGSSQGIRAGLGATMQLVTPGEETSLPWAEDVRPSPPDDTSSAAPAEQRHDPDQLPPPSRSGPEASAHPGEWVVRPGDHLWGIAEEVLAEREGAAPTDAEVHRLWVRLVDANRDRLVDPQDPDLILPGQRLVLPD